MNSEVKIRTFKAKTLPEALRLVRDEFGPEARVLSTRKNVASFWSRLTGATQVEVTAFEGNIQETRLVDHDREFGNDLCDEYQRQLGQDFAAEDTTPQFDYRNRMKQHAQDETADSLLESMIEQCEMQQGRRPTKQTPAALFRLFSDLIESDVDDTFARELVDELQQNCTPAELGDHLQLQRKAIDWLVKHIKAAPEIRAFQGQRRIVALVGPTGVGKTTTIAKLAANLRLRDKRRVGLITVDTYRVAAVDQLRAYADIIDLPMEVVTTPREMRAAVARLADVEIVLIDTAGRSPRDEIQIQELKAMLSEARPDEVQLVLSSVSGGRQLTRLADQFATVGPTSLLLTKLDESISHGHLLSLLCRSQLPLSYTTHGQSVPDDIQPASPLAFVESSLEFS